MRLVGKNKAQQPGPPPCPSLLASLRVPGPPSLQGLFPGATASSEKSSGSRQIHRHLLKVCPSMCSCAV